MAAASITCPRIVVQEHSTVVLQFPKSLGTRCGEFWTLFGQLLWRGYLGLFFGIGCFSVILVFVILGAALLFLLSWAFLWIPLIMNYCHKPPGMALVDFSIRNVTAFQSVPNTTDSPWLVNSAFNATFSTWNRNSVSKCFTTYRQLDLVMEYKGQVILQQQIPLAFSLKPGKSHNLPVEMKGVNAQLVKNVKDVGPYMQAELRSDNITFDLYYALRYLIADRRSKWLNTGCVVVAKPPLLSALGTMVTQDCYSI